jgi:hypothetical protein
MIAMQQMRATVVCPRQNLRMVIPDAPAIRDDGTL